MFRLALVPAQTALRTLQAGGVQAGPNRSAPLHRLCRFCKIAAPPGAAVG